MDRYGNFGTVEIKPAGSLYLSMQMVQRKVNYTISRIFNQFPCFSIALQIAFKT